MLLRLWAFLASTPLGLLAAFAASQGMPPTPTRAGLAAVLGGAFGAGLASLAVRSGDDAPDRAAHVARGAGVALAAVPALYAVALGLGPPAWGWLALVIGPVLLAQWRASRASTPAPSLGRRVASAFAVLLLAAVAAAVVAAAYAQLAPAAAEPDASLRARSLDVDSRVPLAAPLHCGPATSGVEVLASSGVAPQLDADGATLWFEAKADDGRQQIFRRAASGEIVCWTCAEPGNNRRPAPSPHGGSLLFDTDRFASWQRPGDTEVMLATTKGEARPRVAARRLTVSPGRDDHARFDPAGAAALWSHAGSRGFEMRLASISSGHGGFLLGEPTTILRGRASWLVPLGWAPDARTLVVGFGQPLRPLRGLRLDPATGERGWLDGGLLAGSAAFSADGRTLALATTRSAGAARLIPSALGDVLARLPLGPPRGDGTEVHVGEPAGPLAPLALGEVAAWGVPTGLALAPDGRSLVLGQRGAGAERIVRIGLACAE